MTISAKSTLTRKDYEDFVFFMMFGQVDDPIDRCVRLAYGDLARTLRGFSKDDNYLSSRDSAHDELKLQITQAIGKRSQTEFDSWHRDVCDSLKRLFSDVDVGLPFTIGHSQKWVNMTFKYVFTISALGKNDLSAYLPIYEFCHVPIDGYVTQWLRAQNKGIPHLVDAWSKHDNYAEYLDLQKAIRTSFQKIPLDLEFSIWLEEAKRAQGGNLSDLSKNF